MNIKKFKGREGVSEVIGTVLLLAIAVIIFSSLIVYVLSSTDVSPSAPDVHFVGSIDASQYAIVEHRGGESIPIEDVKVILWKGEEESASFEGQALSDILQDTNDNGRWDIGDYIEINCTEYFGQISRWQISMAIIDKPSNSVVMSGVLQHGILHTMPPVARFTYAPWDPKTQEIVTFNASESYDPDGGAIQSYQWNFGDDSTGSGMVVVHQYQYPGNYTVTLTVTDDEGQTDSTSSPYGVPTEVIVTDNQEPAVSFTWSNNTGQSGVIDFTDGSYDTDGEIVSWHWNFGDGSISTSQNPSHYYNRSGTYTVTLVVTDDNGAINSTSLDVVVPNLEPEAFFSYSPSNPTTKHYIFFDGSDSFDRDGSIHNYSWDLNGDSQFGDAYGAKPSTTYSSPGNYTVRLKVTDDLGATGIETKTITVISPLTSRSVLVVDNTPTTPRDWDGTDKIIQALSNLGFSYATGKAIDSWQFVEGSEAGKNITSTLLDEYDIVIWSCGDFPGDGGNAMYDGNPNTWTTSMTEGSDDESNHVYEIYEHMTHNGTLLLCGTYAVRDLQDYPGNGANDDEIWLGGTLGLIEPDGGINVGYHSGQTGYFATDYYSNSGTFSYGPIQGSGILTGRVGTSSDSDTYGVANLEIVSPIDMYELNKQGDMLFNDSLNATGGAGIVLQEGFETSFPPNGWAEYRLGTTAGGGWQANSRAGGGNCAYHHYTQHPSQYCIDWIVTPQFTVPPGGVLDFEEWNRWMEYYDYHGVMISTGSGDPSGGDFVELEEMSDPTYQNWVDRSIDISSYAGQDVYIAFLYKGGYAAAWAIDNVEVYSSGDYILTGEYAIDAERGANRSVVLGFDLNSDAITDESREAYLRNVLNWMAEGVGYETEVYVDNDRPPEWYDETHLHTIQEGIDAVSFGGTVYVYDGDAYDGAVVDKSVNLVGQGTPVIRGSGEAALKVTADWAYIEGFTIYNQTGQTLQRGIYIDNRSRATILNCTIYNAEKGIHAYRSSNTTIQSNIIHNTTYGMHIQRSSGLTITGNTLRDNSYGLSVRYTVDCEVSQNTIHDNDEGVYLYETDRGRIINNDIYSHTDYGIRLVSTPTNNYVIGNTIYQNPYGIYLDLSTRNTIQNNVVSDNTNSGIHLASSSSQNTLWNNTVTGNGNGIYLDDSGSNSLLYNAVNHSQGKGIYLSSSGGNALYYNQVMNSGSEGVVFYGSSDSNTFSFNTLHNNTYGLKIESSRNTYAGNNTITSNRMDGMYLVRPLDTVYGNNTITNNTIYHNARYGIHLYSASGNMLSNNVVHSNVEKGMFLRSSSDDNHINLNLIYNNSCGVSIDRSGFNHITNNTVHNHTSQGISIENYASENDLLFNTLEYNTYGIAIQSSNLNNISHNIIKHHQQHGITAISSNTNAFYDNTIHDNLQDGVYISSSDNNRVTTNLIYNNNYGIHLVSSGGTGNTILNNTVHGNANHGIYLEGSKSSTDGNNQILENEIYGNAGNGIHLTSSKGNAVQSNYLHDNNHGIYLSSSNSNDLSSNVIYGHRGTGIYLSNSNDNTVLANQVSENAENGLYLNTCSRTAIENNSIFLNQNHGIHFYKSSEGSSYPIQYNSIYSNANNGVFLDSSDANHFIKNNIWNNSCGVNMSHSTGNEISQNNISTNGYGIYIAHGDCTGNRMWWNNFINNTLHNDSQAYDAGNNSWYEGTEGNYWNDHLESTPYTIPPSGVQDKYPLSSIKQWWL